MLQKLILVFNSPPFFSNKMHKFLNKQVTCRFPVQSMYGWGSSFTGAAFKRPFTLTPWRFRSATKLRRKVDGILWQCQEKAKGYHKMLLMNYTKILLTCHLASTILRYSYSSCLRPWIKLWPKHYSFKSFDYTDYVRLWPIKTTEQFLFSMTNNDACAIVIDIKKEHINLTKKNGNLLLLLNLRFFFHQERCFYPSTQKLPTHNLEYNTYSYPATLWSKIQPVRALPVPSKCWENK